MLLGKLLKSTEKKYKKIPVKGISFDSRKVKKNYIFFALKGKNNLGIRFIDEAISKGASAIITNKEKIPKKIKIPYIFVKDARKSLAEACSNFYKSKPKNIIAVTGTNGKSSVAYFFYQILKMNNVKSAAVGTLGIISKKYNSKTALTTMDPLSLHKNLEILRRKKIDHVILEASSHGLDQKRLNNLNIKIGIFTNLSHDHLDYHKNMRSYLNSKMYLFKNLLNKSSKIITDKENKEFKVINKIAKKRGIKISTTGKNFGDLKIIKNDYEKEKQITEISYQNKKFKVEIPLIGFFQIKNLVMAILAAQKCGIDIKKIFSRINKIRPASGRLELVAKLNNNSQVIVDFAHTPHALEQTLIAIKKQFKSKIIIVFGCGGERDKKKRFIMGKIAKKYCRKIFITDDNPRNENPKKIRNQILKGCRKIAIDIGNRKEAIKSAIKEIQPNEILLVAGKGHEQIQDYGKKIQNFSDQKVIKKLIFKEKISPNEFNYKDFLLKKALDKKEIKKVQYNGVSINTRTIKKNDLFFAINGKKKNGHDYVEQALKKGAIRAVISKSRKKFPKNKIIKVRDTLMSLNKLATITRATTTAKIIGITGSVGKTTLKNLVGFSLKDYGIVHHSPFSFNNKFGVPISVSNLKKNTDFGVFEIGMDKKGEIDKLSKIVKPEIAVITNITGAHFKNFKSLKDIAKAKAEIIDNLPKYGSLVLNKDENFFKFFSSRAKKRKLNIITFSSHKNADISLVETKKISRLYRLKILVKNKIFYFYITHPITNFINNILACVSILFILNLDLNKMIKKFCNFNIPSGRGDVTVVKKFNKKFKFIDESYNANPLSMHSAIKNMNYYRIKDGSKKIIFLGDMLELGKKSKKFHRELSSVINKSDVDKVFVYGNYIKETFNSLSSNKKGKIFNNLKEAHDHFSKILHNNDLVMVKGSNATGLNEFSKNIKRGHVSAI